MCFVIVNRKLMQFPQDQSALLDDASDAKGLPASTGRGLQSIAAIGRSLEITDAETSHDPQVGDRATLVEMEGEEELPSSNDASDAEKLSSSTGRGLQSIAAIGRSLEIPEAQNSQEKVRADI